MESKEEKRDTEKAAPVGVPPIGDGPPGVPPVAPTGIPPGPPPGVPPGNCNVNVNSKSNCGRFYNFASSDELYYIKKGKLNNSASLLKNLLNFRKLFHHDKFVNTVC